MRIVSVKEMRDIERNTFDKPIISETLIIENVGIKCSEYIEEISLKHKCVQVAVVVGKGNNGADGLAIARQLHGKGCSVVVLKLFPDQEASRENKIQLQMIIDFGIEVIDVKTIDDLTSFFDDKTEQLVVDSILGTGFNPPLDDYLTGIIEVINASASIIVSIDIPSGVNGDLGSVETAAIMADYTFAIELPKIGYFVNQGPRHIGELSVVRVGFPVEHLIGGDKFLLTSEVLEGVPRRSKFDFKNRFGHVLVIGGSNGLSGACALAAIGALKVGSGLVTAMSWDESLSELSATVLPEIMTAPIKSKHDYCEYDAMVVGPGLGKSKGAQVLLSEVIADFQSDLIIDADGINNLSEEHLNLISKRQAITVLTPHMGEFARLLKIEVNDLIENTEKYLLPFAKSYNCAVLLKSSISYLAMPSGELFISFAPNDGMATAGSGDVLAGLIGGIFAQRIDGERSMQLVGRAMMIHSIAGSLARESYGARFMSASNIIEKIREVFENEEHQELE